MKPNQIDKYIRQQLETVEGKNPPGIERDSSANWERLEKKMDQSEPTKKRSTWLWLVAACAPILLAAGLSLLITQQNEPDASPATIAMLENPSPLQESGGEGKEIYGEFGLNGQQNQKPFVRGRGNLTTPKLDIYDVSGNNNGFVGFRSAPPPPPSPVTSSGTYTVFVDVNGHGSINNPQFYMDDTKIDAGEYERNRNVVRGGSWKDAGYFLSSGQNRVYTYSWDYRSAEQYTPYYENAFLTPLEEPLSTFSVDVDAAAYSNVRRMLNANQLPHPDAVRVEEMVNYFKYNYPEPRDEKPFSVVGEVADCPWAAGHKLVHIGIQGKHIGKDLLPASNLVFLIDVSGSMSDANKLPLLKESLELLVNQLREEDKVSIVVYAGAAGVVLPPTSGDQKRKITAALENLEAGGSTAGGQGIELAYKLAKEHFIKGGNNRIILATDGDFNVGVSTEIGLEGLIEQKRKQGVFLTVLGLGTGNYQDGKMQTLADKGNGNHAYIDNLKEAEKVLVAEFSSTLFTIAKDVKLQVEFNPAKVKSYRLIGYENRMLEKEDFDNDEIDAGEIGSGHTVTAIYEIVPANSRVDLNKTDGLRYQESSLKAAAENELLTVRIRYKQPDENKSVRADYPVLDHGKSLSGASVNFKFSAAVAGFGLLLRNSNYKGTATWDMVADLATRGLGMDSEGYRAEFLTLVRKAKNLDQNREASARFNHF